MATSMTLAGPASAGDDVGRIDPRIVGGTEAAPGAWPSQAALLFGSTTNLWEAQFCGGSVIAASWVLTAAHCVDNMRAADIDVLTGQSDLSGTGGQRIDVVEIRSHPNWNTSTFANDVALLRLDRPTNAPAMNILPPGYESLWTPGTSAVATGWGDTESSPQFPTKLRQVTVPIVSDANCASAYPTVPNKFYASSMVCAGQLSTGGKDTCQGDSGGPLMVNTPGGWAQVGITSWGIGCAEPNLPGVYTRLPNYHSWVQEQIRSGPLVSVADATVTEGNTATVEASFVITLSGPSTSSRTVTYASSRYTAVPESDYVEKAGSVVFAPGETAKTVTITVRGDTTVEPDEAFLVRLVSAYSNVGVADGTAVGLIRNDDAPLASIRDASVTEGNTGTVEAGFVITLSGPSTSSRTVTYASSRYTAVPGSDYVEKAGSVVFAPGETTKTATITVRGDTTIERDEVFVVNLIGAFSNVGFADGNAVGIIRNDDR